MAESKWVIEVKQKLDLMVDATTEISHWNKRSIYKVPACVTDLHKKAYKPQIVSFGPYHHGETHFEPMEEHKQRALLHFLKRSGKPLESFVDSLQQVVEDLKNSYDLLDLKWQTDDTGYFLPMLIRDGCFMLEIFRTSTHSFDDYVHNDPIFSNHGKLYIMPYIRRDMLMVENQLPMLVLEKLIAVETNNTKDEDYVNKLIIKFFSPGTNVSNINMGKCLHVLDVYRKSLIHQEQPRKKKRHHHRRLLSSDGSDDDHIIPTATELHEAGIRFKKSKSLSLKDITFKNGVLKLPLVVIDDAAESMFLNLMAFERLHVGAGNEITSYIFFMDNLIDNEKDVALLQSKGIIQNVMGSDKALAKLFNSLSNDITLDPESNLNAVHQKVNEYWKKPWNAWRANLIHTYFRNPWAILSLIAAFFLFALTIVQTIYTVYPYYHPSNSPPPSPALAPVPSLPPQPMASPGHNPPPPPPRPMASRKHNLPPHH
ncbi:hypothetical protein LWI28_020570 [Acer negundo]|uniref:Uncharacterized protein n=1 Tax=Acer negundo TaxID=4023 RepID=A0AAD5IA98_ACENE|nr:hypothetical protein LWI28_020570 [Acer negundo]KAK4836014.1 hypothetical protein QYF36_017464 [Acer negundo]